PRGKQMSEVKVNIAHKETVSSFLQLNTVIICLRFVPTASRLSGKLYFFSTSKAHVPLRKTGSVVPSAFTPSMLSFSEPIIKSTCIKLSLTPCLSNSSSLIEAPRDNLYVYALPIARGQEAFSSNSVLEKINPDWETGDSCGTRATSPRRRAPSSVSSKCFSVSSPCSALKSTTLPSLNVNVKLSI